MNTTQRWIVVAVMGSLIVLTLVAALIVPRSRFGSLPPNLPPLPCGDAIAVATYLQHGTKGVCVFGHVWWYARGRWSTATAPSELFLKP